MAVLHFIHLFTHQSNISGVILPLTHVESGIIYLTYVIPPQLPSSETT